MTRPDLDALAALLERATPGPWTDDPNGEARNVRSPDGGIVAQMGHLRGWHGAGGRKPKTEPPANAALIVAAVNAMPDLLAYVRELESDRTRLAQINANMAKHDRVAALAMRERCAQACEERALIYDGLESGASTRYFSDKMRGARTAAEECAAAIRALEP